MDRKPYLLTLFSLFSCLVVFSVAPVLHAENDDSQKHEESKPDEGPPEADSVWGAMKYSGYYIKKGSVTTGQSIKKGSIKAGEGIQKGGKTMGKGFKKAGHEIKGFFVGD